MQDLHLDNDAIVNFDFAYPLSKETDLKVRVICHNKFLQGQDNFPGFEINKLAVNQRWRSPLFFKAGEIILWVPRYIHIVILSIVSDYNGDCTI